MDYDRLSGRVLDTASARGAQYADVRFEVARAERIEVRNGVISTLSDASSGGYGVRALVDGAWGFAAESQPSDASADRVAALAVEIARAGAAVGRRRFAQPPARAYNDTFATPFAIDPATMGHADRGRRAIRIED